MTDHATATPPESEKESNKNITQSSLNICLIGATGVGKTCFLGGLYLLNTMQQNNKLRTYSPHKSTTQLLKATADQLCSGTWPPPTATSNKFILEVFYNNTAFHLEVLDYPGEDFLEILGDLKAQPDAKAMVNQFHNADVILFLIDATWLKQLSIYQTRDSTIDAINSALAHCENKAVAFVLTKWDVILAEQAEVNAKQFIDGHWRGIKEVIKNKNIIANFFGISAIGSNPNQPYPEGYEALFAWIFTREKRKQFWQRYKMPIVITSLTALLSIGYFSNQLYTQTQSNQVARDVLADQGLTLKQQLARLLDLNWQNEQISYQLAQRVNQWLQDRSTQLSTANSLKSVQRLTAEIADLTTLASPWQSRFEALHSEAQQRLHDLRIAQVRQALQQRQVDYVDIFQQFERDYPASNGLTLLRNQFQHVRHSLAAEALDKIRNIPLISQDSFRTVSEQLTRFIENYPDYEQLPVIENVRNVTRLLAQKQEFVLNVKWSIAGNEAINQKVVILVGGKNAMVLEGGDKTVRRTWEASRRIVWQVGQRVQVRLFSNNWLSDELLGEKYETGGLAILLLADTVDLISVSGEIQGDLKVELSLEAITTEAARQVRQYLSL